MNQQDAEKLVETYLMKAGRDGDLSVLEQIAQPDMVDEANQAFGGPAGRQGLVEHVVGFRRAVQDLEIDIRRVVAGENEILFWWQFTGRHVKPWLGRPASNDMISGQVFSFFELRDDRVSRYRLWLAAELDETVTFDPARVLARQASGSK